MPPKRTPRAASAVTLTLLAATLAGISPAEAATATPTRAAHSTTTEQVPTSAPLARAGSSHSRVKAAGVAASAGHGRIDASWNRPAQIPRGQRVTYRVSIRTGNQPWTPVACPARATRCEITDVTPGQPYQIRVTARTNTRTVPTLSRSVTPYTTTTPPTALTATPTAWHDHVQLLWRPPADNRGAAPTRYVVEQRRTGYDWQTASSRSAQTRSDQGAETSAVIGNLAPGTTYEFRVAAENPAGLSTWSTSATITTPTQRPSAVTSLNARAGNTSVDLTWNAATTSDGSTINGYTVTTAPTGGSVTYLTETSARVSGLTNGITYTFTVTARTSSGDGPPTSTSATPHSTPGQPQDLRVTTTDSTAELTWGAPDGNGAPITDYVIEYSTAADGPWERVSQPASTQGSATLTGLTRGATYYLRVAARNSAGPGPWSATVNARTGNTQRFEYIGNTNQTFTVPAGITTLHLDLAGGQGGDQGTYGSRVVTSITVTPGQELTVQVGQKGGGIGYQCVEGGPWSSDGGWPGGGRSGDANLLVGCAIAAGGGGGYSGVFTGSISQAGALAIAGGGGGTNSTASSYPTEHTGGNGGDGTTSHGGSAGTPHWTFAPPTPGTALTGGDGGSVSSGNDRGYAGGGGGGGYYGGGGGGGGQYGRYGGDGGTGASYARGNATVTASHQAGNGYVVISW